MAFFWTATFIQLVKTSSNMYLTSQGAIYGLMARYLRASEPTRLDIRGDSSLGLEPCASFRGWTGTSLDCRT